MRYFIGIALPEEIKQELIYLQKTLKKAALFSGRYVPAENLHSTLLFLGSLSKEDLLKIQEGLRTVSFPALTAELGSVGSTARVVWVQIISEELAALHDELVSLLPKYHEKRKFIGHITVARVDNVSAQEKVTTYRVAPLTWQVKSYGLYSSVTYQEGPTYTLIEEYSLIRK